MLAILLYINTGIASGKRMIASSTLSLSVDDPQKRTYSHGTTIVATAEAECLVPQRLLRSSFSLRCLASPHQALYACPDEPDIADVAIDFIYRTRH